MMKTMMMRRNITELHLKLRKVIMIADVALQLPLTVALVAAPGERDEGE